MNKLLRVVAGLGLFVAACGFAAEPANPQAADSIVLFNGKDLTGWVAEGVTEYKDDGGRTQPVWSVRDGLIHCAGKGFGFLRYGEREFGDFVFHVEYRMAPRCNSGLGIRTVPFTTKQPKASRPSFAAYEIQLQDDAGKPPTKHTSGSLYRYVAPKVNAVKAAPEWNSVDIECIGPHIRIRINGEEILAVDQRTVAEIKDKPLKGFVCLQNHGGQIEFRNVRIQEKRGTASGQP
jgi:hypothetical protein